MNAGMTNRKRFYKAVDISEAADGFSVLLDQRAVRSPGGAALLLPIRMSAGMDTGSGLVFVRDIL